MSGAVASASSSTGLPGYDGTPGQVPPKEASKIAGVVGQLQGLLGDQGLLGTSRNSDMQQVAHTLDALSPPERDAVVSKLSDQDLQSLAGNIDHGGVFGAQGLSADQRTDLFNTMARSLSGQQLARVSQSLSDPKDIQKFGAAVSTFASNGAKASFVAHMAGATTSDRMGAHHTGFGYNQADLTNPTAQSVGQVLGSLKGDSAHFNAAVKSLNDDQLGAVMKASTGATSTSSDGATSFAYDPHTLVGVLNAAASSHDPAVKARVFIAGAQQDGEIASAENPLAANATAADSAKAVTAGLQHILDSDTTGVVDQLQKAEESGHSLTTYVQQQLAQGAPGEKVIGGDIAKLQRGNGLNQDPIHRMNAQARGSGGARYYANATNLGYFSGAAQAAVRKQASSASDQASLIGSIFSAGATVAAGPAGPYVGAAVRVASGAAVTQVASAVKSDRMQLSDAFEKLSVPQDPKTGHAYLGAATPAFRSASNSVILDNVK